MVITMPSYDINIIVVSKLFHNRFVSYTVIALLTGRAREVHPLMYVVSVAFAINFALR